MSEIEDSMMNKEKYISPQEIEDIFSNKDKNINNPYLSKDLTKLNLSNVNLASEKDYVIIGKIFQSFQNISKILLKNCKLTSLPDIIINSKKISSLDIRGNDFKNFEKLIQDLTKMSNLTELKMDLIDQNQVLLTLSNLPNIILLNGKSTKGSFSIIDIGFKDIEDISLECYLDSYNKIVNKLNQKDETHSFLDKFQNLLYEEEEKLKNILNKNIPNYIYANTTLKSHLDLQKNLSQKFLKCLDKESSMIANTIFDIVFKTGNRLVDLINLLYPKIEEKSENLRNELEEAWKAAGEISDYETKYKNLKDKKNILETNIDIMEKKLSKLEKENKIITQKFNKKAKEILKNSEKANKFLLNDNNANNSSYLNHTYQNNLNNFFKKSTFNQDISKEIKVNKQNQSVSYNQNVPYNINFSSDNNNLNSNSMNVNDNTQQINNNQDLLKYLTMSQNRKPLSIKVTKDIINELYNSKAYYDKKCYENRQPSGTLEQYMYIYLNTKYGLKNLVIEWASAIINSIKLYSREDCEINLFGKILKNEQEEDSRFIISKLKEHISELLEYYYKTKHPLKSKEEIMQIMESKKNGVLIEEEWKGIIYYIYNDDDSQIMENKILNFIKEQNNKIFFILENGDELNNERFITYQNTTNMDKYNYKKLNNNITDIYLTDKKKVTREDLYNINKLRLEENIPYKDFIQLVCENQIQNREKYLRRFVKLFRKFDKDGDGILDEEQFINMVKSIPYCQKNINEYIDKFLAIIDPFNHKKITFNNCVIVFSSEVINENENEGYFNQGFSNIESPNIGLNIQNETTLLDKICLGN